jgi:hypothetical protein
MNQKFSSQLLTSKTHLEYKQADSAVINLFQNETYLKHISLTQPLERDYDQALKRYIAK